MRRTGRLPSRANKAAQALFHPMTLGRLSAEDDLSVTHDVGTWSDLPTDGHSWPKNHRLRGQLASSGVQTA
ncbi:MAG: hypothetical protein RJB60_682 [Pseudomonadota bacterium]|jgi:hypothetical protein